MFPLELVTMLGSGILGGVMSLVAMKMKMAAQNHSMMVAGLNAQSQAFDLARKHKDPKFQFTRRAIALMVTFSVLVLPLLVAAFKPDIIVTFGYTEFHPGFLFFTDGRDVVKWVVTTGLTITPLHTHTVMAIMGLYFGASITKNA